MVFCKTFDMTMKSSKASSAAQGGIHPQQAMPILVWATDGGTGQLQICNGKKPATSRNYLMIYGGSLVKSAMIIDRRLLGLLLPSQNNSLLGCQ